MKHSRLWMLAAIVVCGAMTALTSCSNEDDPVGQAGRTVSQADVDAFGGIDKCFAAEPIPDGVWARPQALRQ